MLIDQIQSDLKNAQLSREEVKVGALRLLLSEIRNFEIQKGAKECALDEDIVIIVSREVKKRKEAAEAFRQGGREESALKEEAELKVLTAYLPKQFSNEELTKIVEETIHEMGISSFSDMGKVTGAVMAKVRGQAEGGVVSAIVKGKLNNV